MKTNKFIKNTILVGFLLTSLVIVISCFNINPAQASLWDLVNEGDRMGSIRSAFGDDTSWTEDPRMVTVRVIQIFLSFVGIIVVIYIIWAGIKWMTSAGNQEQVNEAKKHLRAAVIGLIIILLAYVISAFIADFIDDAMYGEFG